MKKILLTLAAVAMSAAMMAAPYVETYDFRALVEEANDGFYPLTFPDGDKTDGTSYLVSYGENDFNGRFEADYRAEIEKTWRLRKNSNTTYTGLCTSWKWRTFVVKNLLAGDIVTINFYDTENKLEFRDSNPRVKIGEEGSELSNGTLIISGQEYIVTRDCDLTLRTTNAADAADKRVYIYSITIEHPETFVQYAPAAENVDFSSTVKWEKNGITFTFGNGEWSDGNFSSASYEDNQTGFNRYAAAAGDHSITVNAAFTGILRVYGQFTHDLILKNNADNKEQHSGWFGSATWAAVSFAVEAGQSYTLTTGTASRYHGFCFKPTSSLNISELAVGGGLTLEEGKEYTYDKNAANIEGVRVKLNRKFYKNNVYTICLPFDVPADKIETYFGTGVKVYDITGYGDDYIQFNELTTGQMNHGYAYILDFREATGHMSDGIKFYTHNGTGNEVTIDQADVDAKQIDGNKIFCGTFNPKTIEASNYILNMIDGEPEIVQAGEEHKNVNSFRGYFDVPAAVGGGEGAPRRIILGTNAATGIDEIDGVPVLNIDAPMYNVMGQQVDKTYKGVVIQNGHKFMLQ